jgi:hypothetical protein
LLVNDLRIAELFGRSKVYNVPLVSRLFIHEATSNGLLYTSILPP